LQIAITAICSLKICQIALNESVKDRKIIHFTDLWKFFLHLLNAKKIAWRGSVLILASKIFYVSLQPETDNPFRDGFGMWRDLAACNHLKKC
ncbi:MAG: hypothetical protein IIU81_02630, partial [Peptococcaceae bacterium]|nr:hypothetical protein [Peptococcaceae bacterium]